MLFLVVRTITMVKVSLLFVFMISTMISSAHEYYFAFAEMEYKSDTKKLELTLVVSTHDIEHWLQNKGVKVKELENHTKDLTLQKEFETKLLSGFNITYEKISISLKMIGYEVLDNGLSNFYFVSEAIEIKNQFSVRFDLLMDDYPEQQNKLTFIYNEKKQTFPFLQATREQFIKLED